MAESAPGTRVRILIADDEADLREILRDQLQTMDLSIDGRRCIIEIAEARNGVEALERISEHPFDAILTDILMPEKSGLQLLASLRADLREIPVVILSGHGDKEKVAEAQRLGCFAFLDKPCKSADVRAVMRRAVIQGLAIRAASAQQEMEIQTQLRRFREDTPGRLRQIKMVLRSIMISGDGLHRSDVCAITEAGKTHRKIAS